MTAHFPGLVQAFKKKRKVCRYNNGNASKLVVFKTTLFAWSYVRASILITCGKHLHDHIISLRWEVWAHKTTLVSPTF
jgi:hypothetical protein